MRMWMLPPKGMCRKHLLKEHFEIHMFVVLLRKKKPIGGYLERGYLEIHRLTQRHEELVQEMLRRGIAHDTELMHFEHKFGGYVDVTKSLRELHQRCAICRFRHHRWVVQEVGG